MEYRNFKLTKIIGASPSSWKFRATIDICTGSWIFKKTETHEVYRKYAELWSFVETGEFTFGNLCERLERSFCAKQGKDLHSCNILDEKDLMKGAFPELTNAADQLMEIELPRNKK